MTPRLGTDGNRIVYPVRGIVQVFHRFGEHPERRTVLYVLALVVAAIVTAASLIARGVRRRSTSDRVRACPRCRRRRAHQRSIDGEHRAVDHALADAVCSSPLRAPGGGARRRGLDAGRPELTSRRRDRAPRLKWATYTSTRFISGAATGLAAQATVSIVPSTFGGLIAATLVGAFVNEVLDLVFTMITASVRRGSVLETGRTIAPLLVLVPPLFAPVVALLAFMYVEVSPWTLALFLVPAMASQRLYGLYQEEHRLAADLSTANETLEGKPSIRRRPHCYAGCEGSIHGWTLRGSCDLLARHRRANGSSGRGSSACVSLRTCS